MKKIDSLNTPASGGVCTIRLLYEVVGDEVYDKVYLDNYLEREIFDLARAIKDAEYETASIRQL